MLMKSCTKCSQEKPLTAEYYPLHNKTKSGFDSWCRTCRSSYRNEISRGKFRNVISDEDLKMIKATTNECVICGEHVALVVDHDHKSGKIRGMLFNHCNRGLGHFKDDPMLLEFAAQYLYASADLPQWDKYKSDLAWKC